MDVANEASVIPSLDDCDDGFVNSAGIGRDAPFLETCVELFRSAPPDEIAVAALFLLDDRRAFCPAHIFSTSMPASPRPDVSRTQGSLHSATPLVS
jgi:hypothetical protein